MQNFDPNAAAGEDSGIFGLPFSIEQAQLVLLPVPWEVTTSYGGGTSLGPRAILNASRQIDLFDLELGNFYRHGIALMDESTEVQTWNQAAQQLAHPVIAAGGSGNDPQLLAAVEKVNDYSHKLNHYVYNTVKNLLAQGKQVGVIGGDHSTPFGAITAFLEKYPRMGMLHVDAHADLRKAYEGFTDSHASIMYNVITRTKLTKLVQVGLRDLCEEEFEFIKQQSSRITAFFDVDMSTQKMNGESWASICDQIIKQLPEEVYISFDIDGLDPRYCPHTGTPVPGGLDFAEATYLIKKVAQSGRKIIGFDLNEVSPGSSTAAALDTPDPAAEWDANVGARLLYKLCGWSLYRN